MKEKIKWIKGFEGLYKISTSGTVYSYVRNPNAPKILSPRKSGSGYLMVSLSGDQKYVHQIVAENFIVNRNKKRYNIVGFKDGNPLNTTADNLVWTNEMGRTTRYFKNKKSQLSQQGMVSDKISKEQLVQIATLLKNSKARNKQEIIASLFGIHRITLYRIRKTKEFLQLQKSI